MHAISHLDSADKTVSFSPFVLQVALALFQLTGNRTEDTSLLVASTRKSIQKSTSSCLGDGCSVPGLLNCW